MGFNGTGQFSFTYNWVNDAANGIPITDSRMDTQFNDAAQGFDDCVTRDGQSPFTANIPAGGFLLTGLGQPGNIGDALAWGRSVNVPSVTITSPAATATNPLILTGTTTASSYIDLNNTGGDVRIAVENSTGNSVVTGAPPYTGNIGTAVTRQFNLFTNNRIGATIGTDQSLLTGTTTDGGWTGLAKFESVTAGYAVSAYSNSVTTGSARITRVDTAGVTLDLFYFNGLTPVGSVSTNGTNTAYNTSSDARLKDNIQDAGDPWSIISNLRVRSWDWKSNGKHEAFGFVAQEEYAVFPDAVVIGDNGDDIVRQWQRDDGKLVPMLVKMVQILEARIAALEAK